MKMLRHLIFLALCFSGIYVRAQGDPFWEYYNLLPDCQNCNGEATLIAAGGVAPYQYLWSNGLTGGVQTGLCSGTYLVTISDAAGNSSVNSITISPYASFELAVGGSGNCITAGQNTGALEVITENNANYTFLWSTGATTTQIAGLGLGGYSVTATDVRGCSKTAYGAVYSDEAPNISIKICGSTVQFDTIWPTNPVIGAYVELPGGLTWHNPQIIGNVPPGTYTYHFSSPCGSFQQNFTVGAGIAITGNITNATCGSNDGAVDVSVAGSGVPPYTYAWSNGATTQDISNVPGSTYTLTVTDAQGCSKTSSYAVIGIDANIDLNLLVHCAQTINVEITGATAPFDYYFVSPDGSVYAEESDIHLNSWDYKEAGWNVIRIIDANGCGAIDSILTPEPVDISLYHCNNKLYASISGNPNAPLTYQWQGNGIDCPTCLVTGYDPDVLSGWVGFVIYFDNGICAGSNFVNVSAPPKCPAMIQGTLYADTNGDCQYGATESGIGAQYVKATSISTGNNHFQSTDANGDFTMILEPGLWSVSGLSNAPYYSICPAGELVNLTTLDTPVVNFGYTPAVLCPYTTVDLGAERLRICQNNQVVAHYCNLGTATAEDATVDITLPASLSLSSSSIPVFSQTGNTHTFSVGDLDPQECGQFSLQVFLNCTTQLGQSHCVEAHIFPDSLCIPPNAQWTGAKVSLTGACDQDSLRFSLQNTGTGNMEEALEYFIVEDQIILMRSAFQLQPGQKLNFSVPANGSTWHVSAEQVDNYPGFDLPNLTFEGCGTNAAGTYSTGYANQFPLNDADPFLDILCLPGQASFDPNEKTTFPAGFGEVHYITPADALEYTLYFQNTGNDTAFNVVLRDTLSIHLDPGSIQPGAASHPYRFELSGQGAVAFFFDNIYLPDSTTNLAASQGFVHFSVKQKPGNADFSVIENRAAIYFDHNPPVITNTVWHVVYENFVLELTPVNNPYDAVATARVYPNPFSEMTLIELSTQVPSATLTVCDLLGKTVLNTPFSGQSVKLDANQLPSGVYLLRIEDGNGQLIARGKMVKQ